MIELDIVIPVYNEGANIVPVLRAIEREVHTPLRVTICYDFEDDDTLAAIRGSDLQGIGIRTLRNTGSGAFGAVVTGLQASEAPAVLVFAADDDYNAGRIDVLVQRCREGADVVVASRFMRGGSMVGCPVVKNVLVRSAAWLIRTAARVPTHDATNGFRLFSRRVVRRIPLESTRGFTYSIEYLVKCHRLGWPIAEVPVIWIERRHGRSRFQILHWIPDYVRWLVYAFATTYLRRGPGTVDLLPEEV
ncbi:MAG TPA: glycosyltransferase [Vicinamibacterales bacterium]|nr:glycosyltransferase [Vicinamibacterales bacterium]